MPAFVVFGDLPHGRATAHQRCKLTGDNDDLATGTIIDIEFKHFAIREVLLEILDVFSRGAEKAVDRLPGVSDHPRRILRAAKAPKQCRDRAADVLILVDQNEPVFLAVAVSQFPFAFENPDRERDQVSEIDAVSGGLLLFIEAEDLQELARGLLVYSGIDFSLSRT